MAALVCVVVCALAVYARARQPGLGLVLEADGARGVVRVVGSRQHVGFVLPAELVAIGARDGAPMPVQASDLIEDPDFFDTYPEMAIFFARQSALAEVLRKSEVTLSVRHGDGDVETHRVTPSLPRPSELPGAFWFQILAGTAAFFVSVWVLVLRPRELAVRLFAVMGATITIFTVSAAVYGTRELAFSGVTFRVLSAINHAGANLFGCALVAFFLAHPVRLVSVRAMWLVPAVVVPWVVADVLRIAPNQDWGARAPILLEMTTAIVLGVVQWRATRGEPRGRAILRWLGVSVLVGSGAFVFTVVGSSVIGWFSPISQGYSFGFFLLMHVSFAVGLRRHRAFDLGEWAYQLLFWVLAALAVVACDAVLIAVLDANRALSTWGVLLACGFLYLPARSWLWSKAVSRRRVSEHELFDAVLQVTFASEAREREERWRALLATLFDPLELRPADGPVERAVARDDGIRLDVPMAAGVPALRLEYPWKGRGLVGPRHERLADSLVRLVRHAESRREAFERGVRDERTRIARDMHDDIGAGLMSSLYRSDLGSTRDAIRQAIGDVRSIVNELTWRRLELGDVVAEMRHEAMRRLGEAAIAVDWPLPVEVARTAIGYDVYRHVTSMLRELVTNAIRHSGAETVRVRLETTAERLVLEFADDGRGFDPIAVKRGAGMENLERRASGLGGTITMSRVAGETVTRIDVPTGSAGLSGPAPARDVGEAGGD